MEILIVAKTHMKTSACVGGYELKTKKNVRLLNFGGENQPKDTDFEIGQVWEINYTIRPNLVSPHNEDVIVQNKRFLRTQASLGTFLKNNTIIWQGSPDQIFQGKLLFSTGQSGYITNRGGIPSQSVGFWLPDTDLEMTILSDQKHFFYFGNSPGPHIYALPYVGFQPVTEKIPRGTLVRVSLARWWNPNPNIEEKRCYCQLSGWYADEQDEVQSRYAETIDDLPF